MEEPISTTNKMKAGAFYGTNELLYSTSHTKVANNWESNIPALNMIYKVC